MSEARTRWSAGFRDALWAGLDRAWDLVIVGGGITGAGLCREAARLGLSVLLVEGHDFAWGTSSRSSKLVHGGLRYLTTFQPHLTAESVHERDRLLRDGGGLVEPLDFVLADYEFERLSGWQVRAGLWVYDRLSGRPSARHLDRAAMLAMVPGLAEAGLRGGHMYADAITDDARLVARVLHEATWAGATALNYVAAEGLVRRADGRVVGVALHDRVGERRAEVRARAVVNATGVWADGLRGRLGREPRMRPLRGSHLVFDRALLPVDQAVSLLHPRDRRPLYVYPWEGSTLVGTTDLDHHEDLEREARITEEELAYILEVVAILFPERGIERERVVSTYAGVRPVVRSRTREASAASRDHVVWHEDGLWTVTGGKLTTFRRIALDALRRLRRDLPEIPRRPSDHPALDPPTAALASAVAAGLGEAATRPPSARTRRAPVSWRRSRGRGRRGRSSAGRRTRRGSSTSTTCSSDGRAWGTSSRAAGRRRCRGSARSARGSSAGTTRAGWPRRRATSGSGARRTGCRGATASDGSGVREDR